MSRNAVIALGAMVVLGGVFFATQDKEVRVGVESFELSSLKTEAVTQIEVSGSKAVKLKKEGGTWFIDAKEAADTNPQWVKADLKKVEKLLAEVAKLKSSFMVSKRKDALEGYELTDTKGTQINLKNSSGVVLNLMLGRSNNKGSTYMKLLDDERVFAVRSTLGALVKKDINDWRGRDIGAQAC